VQVRSEVRYCLPGVGVGVEFIGLSGKDQKAILGEIGLPERRRVSSRSTRGKSGKKKSKKR
jgi:hypothetical protein